MPYNAGIYSNLGGVYFAMGKYEQAERVWLAAANLAPDDLVSRRHLLLLYDRQGQAERYRTLLLSMAARKDAPPDVLSQAAELKLRESKPAEACRMLGRALRAGLDSAYVCDLQRRYPELQLLTCENR